MEPTSQEQYLLEEILTNQEINDIIIKWKNNSNKQLGSTWKILRKELRPASKELAGCMGVHLKLTLDIEFEKTEQKIRLFIKCVPKNNKPRTDFMDGGNFYRKEMSAYRILEEMDDGRPRSWSKVYLCNEHVVVMPDLSAEGFTTTSKMELMDYDHLKLAVESIARFHATTVDYQTKNTRNGLIKCTVYEDYPVLDFENYFKDSNWLRAAAKLGADFLREFSLKHKDVVTRDSEIEKKIFKSFVEVCNTLEIHEDTINVVLHKDLWANNIMYKYKDHKPDQVILIDYQIARLGPPAYDLTNLIYFNTNKDIRSKNEQEIKRLYYDRFIDLLSPKSKEMIKPLGYTFEKFEELYEIARAKGMVTSICVYPYILMDGESIGMLLDDHENFNYFMEVNRSEPVIEYARNNQVFRERLLETCEEYCERYIFDKIH